MPPSPAFGCSPSREMSPDKHKRGRSFESKFLFKERADDDLALFNEVQTREEDNFLLQSSDDIDDVFSTKLKYFSESKLGVHVRARGESSDLLNADGEKNDYDWLLTPPDTPLFPSLDDEPAPVSVAPRGRPRSQPISISRSSTMEKSYRSSRGSPSPNRLSPSSRTGNSMSQARGRPSSASSSSPTPSQRHVSPVRRPSPPSSKTVSPSRRSSTPTSRRMSTGSTGTRGISPVNANRGNSASPKIRAWQSNFPGFSTEAPPNLRTSLEDRPATYVRGSSPASRTSRDSTSKYRRQSMSPTASRSASSHDPSSHSKGSIASSGDDDLDSLHSIPVGSLDRFSTKRGGVFSNNRSPILPKRPGRISSPSSVPKRSVDSGIRQMDNRKTPPNMFRPLLSSVPSTSLYVGKASSAYRPLISRDSSVTNSSNASSDRLRIGVLDTESEHNQDDLASEYGKVQDTDVQEVLFPFENGDEFIEDMGHKNHNVSVDVRRDDLVSDLILESYTAGSIRPSHPGMVLVASVPHEDPHIEDDILAVDSAEKIEVCSQCGSRYHVISNMEFDSKFCPECEIKNKALTITHFEKKEGACESSALPSVQRSENHGSSAKVGSLLDVYPKPLGTDICELNIFQGEGNVRDEYDANNNTHSHENLLNKRLDEGKNLRTANQQALDQASIDCVLRDSHIKSQQLQSDNNQSDLEINAPGSPGISVLLRRSSSSKGPIVQGRTFTATSSSYDGVSYAHESTNSLRNSVGRSSVSVPSSVNFALVRQTETRVQRQLSSCRSDSEDYKSDLITKPLSRRSSFSGILTQSQSLGLQSSTNEENLGVSAYSMEYSDKSGVALQDQVVGLEDARLEKTDKAITELKIQGGDNCKCNESTEANHATSELSNHSLSVQLEDPSSLSVSNEEECASCNENFSKDAKSDLDEEASARIPESSFGEKHAITYSISEVDVLKVPNGALVTSLDDQADNFCQSNSDSKIEEDTQISEAAVDEYPETKIPSSTDKDLASVSGSNTGQDHDAPEESTVLVEGHGRSKTRSLTLEEATDTILFCSSIVHELAYQAVSIAMQKENSEGIVREPLEGIRPAITIVEKSGSDGKDLRGRSAGRTALKSRKPKQKRLDVHSKPNSIKMENDENAGDPMTQNIGIPNKVDSVKPPPKLESKCNCTIM